MNDRLASLPGGVLMRQGVDDSREGRHTVAACLVEIARSRLEEAGLVLSRTSPRPPDSELQLYRLLRAEGGDAYSRYNSLLRELSSFTSALERLMEEKAES